jgi:hypothetical protein
MHLTPYLLHPYCSYRHYNKKTAKVKEWFHIPRQIQNTFSSVPSHLSPHFPAPRKTNRLTAGTAQIREMQQENLPLKQAPVGGKT